MSHARRFAWHAFLTVSTTVLNGALFYVLRLVLYEHLTEAEYGLFYTLFSFATIVQLVVTFGFDPGLVPYVTQFREEKDYAATKSLVVGALVPQGALTLCVVAVLLIAPQWIAARLTAEPAAPALLRILALHALFVLLFKAGQQVLLGEQAMVWRNASDLARAVVCVGGAAWLLHTGWGVYATAIAYTLGAFAEVAVQAAALVISLPQLVRARFSWRPALVRDAFETGKWLSVAFGGIGVFSSVDTLIISLVRGNLADAAAYQIALPTVTIAYSLMVAAALSLMPTVRTLWLRGEHDALVSGIGRLYEGAFLIAIPLGVLMAGFSDLLMARLFHGRILNAPEAFNVLAIGGVAFLLTHIALHTLAGIGQARAAGVAVAAGLAVDLALNPILTFGMGIRGTALAGVAGYCVCAVSATMSIRRHVPVRCGYWAIIGGVGIGVALWGLVAILRS